MPRLLAAGLVAVIANTASAVSFDLRFSNDAFFDTNTTQGQQARAAVTAAANFFALRLNDNLGAITPGGVNSWTATYTDPSTGGAGSAMNLTVAAGQLVVFIGARDLGGSTLGEGGPGGFSASGTSAFLSSVSTRGQGVTQGAGATDFGPWGGGRWRSTVRARLGHSITRARSRAALPTCTRSRFMNSGIFWALEPPIPGTIW